MEVIVYIQLLRSWLSEMGCSRMQSRESYAVSEILGLALVLMIITGAISMILFWGVPHMQDQKAFVALESTLMQLDAMGDVMDDAFSEGAFRENNSGELFGSSKTMSFKLGGGEISLDEKGERFVLWYSLTNDGGGDFLFDISGFGDADDTTFTIDNIGGGLWTAGHLDIYYLDADYDPDTPDIPDVEIVDPQPTIINIGPYNFSDAVRIDIIEDGGEELYGRIWLFDVGSLTYISAGSSTTYEAIMQNGGVLSTSGSVSRYFFNEPKYWPQVLLDEESEMLILRFIQLKKDPNSEVNAIGGTGSGSVDFGIEAFNSTTMEHRTSLFNSGVGEPYLRMIIHGDEGAVSAWRFFYQHRMGFEYNDVDDVLTWGPSSLDITNALFSLNHAVCRFSMEGEI